MLVNGKPADSVSLTDRGLSYGDGVFETIAVKQGTPLRFEKHLQRLLSACQHLNIKFSDSALLTREAQQVAERINDGILKIIITRGQGGRGYRPDQAGEVTRILMDYPWPSYPDDYQQAGIRATVCQTRLARNPLLAGLKHLNRLEQVMARGEWQDEYQEGLMLDTEGQVIEGTMSNVFLVKDNELQTPALDECGVTGVMRESIFEIAKTLGLSVHVNTISLEDVVSSDGLFFCNSVIGIWPVRWLDEHEYQKNNIIHLLMESL